jgi:predicted PurR-regulated permease PerM
MFISQIIPSIQDIIANFDTYTSNGIAYINKLFEDNPGLREFFNETIAKYSVDLDFWLNNTLFAKISTVLMSVSQSVLNVLGFLWDFILGFILSIYILHSKDIFAGQAKKISYSLLSRETANGLLQDVRFVHKTFTGFITGKVIDSVIIGFLCFIGTSILGTPYAALVSVIIGVTNVIPFFGPFLGAIPCSVLIFVVAPLEPLHTVYFVLFILLLQQFDGNVLGPKILGDSTGLSSFWVIFAITIFGGLMGVLGMVIGVPTFAVIFAMIRRHTNNRLHKKGLPTDRDDYFVMDGIGEDNQIIMKNTKKNFESKDEE